MPAHDDRRHLLILGGTAEAAALARLALERFAGRLAVTTSLAGRTETPAPLPGEVRSGGFGGADGLAAYLGERRIDLVIDATHPFAAQISAQARTACAMAGVPRLLLHRRGWERHPLDRWIEVESLAAAAAVLPGFGRRAWLTIGLRDLDSFAALRQMHFLVRLVDPPAAPLPLDSYELLIGRGPFNLAQERHILERHAIDVLVTKASGGAATAAKLVAARERDVPVIMIRRPPPPPGPHVADVGDALDWLAARLAERSPQSATETAS